MSTTTTIPRKAYSTAHAHAAHSKAAKRRKRIKAQIKSKKVEPIAEEVPKPKLETPPVRLLTKPQVLDRVGVTFPTIWKWMREGRFPRSRAIGDLKSVWLESEITEWILALPERQLKGDEV